jgi:hypothetical protein
VLIADLPPTLSLRTADAAARSRPEGNYASPADTSRQHDLTSFPGTCARRPRRTKPCGAAGKGRRSTRRYLRYRSSGPGASRRLGSVCESAVAGDSPAFLEVVCFHLENSTGRVVACVVDREIQVGTGVREDAATSASLVASATKDEASPPNPWMSATTASSEADVRPAATTRSPSLAKNLQSCAPKPRSGPTPIITAFCIGFLRNVPTWSVR